MSGSAINLLCAPRTRTGITVSHRPPPPSASRTAIQRKLRAAVTQPFCAWARRRWQGRRVRYDGLGGAHGHHVPRPAVHRA